MLLFADAAETSEPKPGCPVSGAVSADGERTTELHERRAIPAVHATGGARLFLLAAEDASGNRAASEESTPQQEVPADELNNDAPPPQPELQPADPPEQQGQPPGEHEQDPDAEPAPQSSR